MSLPESTLQHIDELAEAGDVFAAQGQLDVALDNYWAAWELLPEPAIEHAAAGWLLMAIGDVNFLAQDYSAGRDNLSTAMHCPDSLGNPFLHLRLGQCLFELGEQREAAAEFQLAWEEAGAAIFDGEKAKYLKFFEAQQAAS